MSVVETELLDLTLMPLDNWTRDCRSDSLFMKSVTTINGSDGIGRAKWDIPVLRKGKREGVV